MPLGMLYTMAHLASLTDMPAERFVCAATGSNARVYGLDSGLIAPGKAADSCCSMRPTAAPRRRRSPPSSTATSSRSARS